jgi:hypothetical protein
MRSRFEHPPHYADITPPTLAQLERQAKRVRLHYLLMWLCAVPVVGFLVYVLLTN